MRRKCSIFSSLNASNAEKRSSQAYYTHSKQCIISQRNILLQHMKWVPLHTMQHWQFLWHGNRRALYSKFNANVILNVVLNSFLILIPICMFLFVSTFICFAFFHSFFSFLLSCPSVFPSRLQLHCYFQTQAKQKNKYNFYCSMQNLAQFTFFKMLHNTKDAISQKYMFAAL